MARPGHASSAGFFSSDKAPPHRSAASAASASKVSSCAINAFNRQQELGKTWRTRMRMDEVLWQSCDSTLPRGPTCEIEYFHVVSSGLRSFWCSQHQMRKLLSDNSFRRNVVWVDGFALQHLRKESSPVFYCLLSSLACIDFSFHDFPCKYHLEPCQVIRYNSKACPIVWVWFSCISSG